MKIQHIFFDLDNTLWDHRRNAYLTIKDLFEKEEIGLKYNINFEEFHSVYHEINENSGKISAMELLIKNISENTVFMIPLNILGLMIRNYRCISKNIS
jgi:FMN phosphatase YigB (HAD superfamily)